MSVPGPGRVPGSGPARETGRAAGGADGAMEAVIALAGGAGGLALLAGTIAVAGLVRGFTGFGTALIFMPVATSVIDPALAILILVATGMAVWPVLLPGAWRLADRRDVAWMGAAALVAAPLGVAALGLVPEAALRWGVSVVAALTLAALVTGWRYAGRVGWPGLACVGAASGVLGGATGLGGPPAILFYLAGPSGVAQVRANTILFLCVLDVAILANLVAQTAIGGPALALGALLAVPYVATTLVGQALFRPGHARAYRALAYALIGGAILTGLPLWGGA